jgi:hypothetical protein
MATYQISVETIGDPTNYNGYSIYKAKVTIHSKPEKTREEFVIRDGNTPCDWIFPTEAWAKQVIDGLPKK